MKKLLVAVLAVALFAPAFAVENVYVTGDIQTIGISYQDKGVTLGQNFKGTTNRVLFGIGADLVEDVQAKLTFAHENVFGDYNNDSEVGFVGENLNEVWDRTRVAEAYVNISNVFDALEVKVGRQFYGDEKSAVMYFGPTYGYADPVAISSSIYGLPSYTSLDGVSAYYNNDKLNVTAAYFTVEHDGTTLVPEEEWNIGGLDLTYKFSKEISANAYIYDVRERDGARNWGIWGIKPTYENENLKLGVEYASNYSLNSNGWQVKADAALSLGTDNAKFTPRVTYLKSEKYFIAFGNYRPGLMFGTILGGALNNDIATWYSGLGLQNNWEVLNVGLCMKFANLEKWGFGLDFYTINGGHYSSFMGNSWEAKVVYNHNEYVAFNLAGAVLTNKKHLTGSPTALQLGMNIKF